MIRKTPITKKREKYTVVGYFALFYLLFYFMLVSSCKNCWFWPQYNPYFFAFIFAFVATYFIFLIVDKFNQMLSKEEEKINRLEAAVRAIGARKDLEDHLWVSSELKDSKYMAVAGKYKPKKTRAKAKRRKGKK